MISKKSRFAGKKPYSIYSIAPVAAGCLMMLSSGSVYLVSVYSTRLQADLGVSSSDISSYKTWLAIGSWVTLVPMMFTDFFGVKATSIFGLLMVASGYSVLSQMANGNILTNSSIIILLGFIIGHGSAFCHVAAISTNLANTSEESRGAVYGILMANYALSSGVYSQLLSVLNIGIPTFLLICGVSMSCCVLLSYPSNHLLNNGEKTETLLVIPLAITLTTGAVFVALASILDMEFFHYGALGVGGVVILFVFFLSCGMLIFYPFNALLPYKFNKSKSDSLEMNCLSFLIYSNDDHNNNGDNDDGENQSLLNNENANLNIGNDEEGEDTNLNVKVSPLHAYLTTPKQFMAGSSRKKSNKEEEETIPLYWYDILYDARYWLLFFSFAIGSGSGLTVLYNIDRIVDTHIHSYDDDDTTTSQHYVLKTDAIALFSSFNAFGRIGFGFLSDWLLHKDIDISRSWLLCVTCMMMGSGLLWMAFANLFTIKYAVSLVACAYGGFWVVIPSLMVDLYGLSSYFAYFSLTTASPIAGLELFYTLLSETLYNKNKINGSCYGHIACFTDTFYILCGCNGAALIFAILVASFPNALKKTASASR